jgi:hypothetical protein
MNEFSLFDQPKYDAGGTVDSILNVDGTMKVAYTQLVKDTRPNVMGTYLLDFKRAEWGATDELFPVWFLPWASNHVTRMMIPSSASLKQRARATGSAVQVDPDIFFTAAINGCSVFVTGAPENPTVWHGGTEQARSSATANLNVPRFKNLNAAKHWHDIVEQSTTALGQQGPIAQVHKGHYTNLLGTDHTSESMEYMNFLKDNRQKNMRIDTIVPMGSILGVRTGGKWKFYLQKTVEFTITRLTKKRTFTGTKYVDSRGEKGKQAWQRSQGDQMPVATESTKVIRLPVQLTQFYPGTGSAAETARIDPVMVKSILEQY